ncbi:MAG: amino acid-binding protein [Sphingomonas sp.]
MYDIHVLLPHEPGMLARFGEALGSAGVSLEGGGVFLASGDGHAHFLVGDGERARVAAQEAGLKVIAVREVLVRRLDQERPGELGRIAAAIGAAGVNIVTMYSDHANQLILVTDDPQKAASVTRDWAP